MNRFKRAILFVIIGFAMSICIPAFAVDTGKELTRKCRENLRNLNKITAKALKEHDDKTLPTWSPYSNVKTMILGVEYLPKDPVPPTRDCEYFLVNLGNNDYQWYCALHGVLKGKTKLGFKYHEHYITAKVAPRYKVIKNYQQHIKNLYEWTEYSPTLYESIQYRYNTNPITTILILVFAGIAFIFIYKNVF